MTSKISIRLCLMIVVLVAHHSFFSSSLSGVAAQEFVRSGSQCSAVGNIEDITNCLRGTTNCRFLNCKPRTSGPSSSPAATISIQGDRAAFSGSLYIEGCEAASIYLGNFQCTECNITIHNNRIGLFELGGGTQSDAAALTVDGMGSGTLGSSTAAFLQVSSNSIGLKNALDSQMALGFHLKGYDRMQGTLHVLENRILVFDKGTKQSASALYLVKDANNAILLSGAVIKIQNNVFIFSQMGAGVIRLSTFTTIFNGATIEVSDNQFSLVGNDKNTIEGSGIIDGRIVKATMARALLFYQSASTWLHIGKIIVKCNYLARGQFILTLGLLNGDTISTFSGSPSECFTATQELPEPCTNVDCNNHATAIEGNKNDGCTCTCRDNFDGATCDACSSLYEKYPSCTAKLCTVEANCSNHASSVTGTMVDTCSCTCGSRYLGSTCSQCNTAYFNYPNCTANTIFKDCPDVIPIPGNPSSTTASQCALCNNGHYAYHPCTQSNLCYCATGTIPPEYVLPYTFCTEAVAVPGNPHSVTDTMCAVCANASTTGYPCTPLDTYCSCAPGKNGTGTDVPATTEAATTILLTTAEAATTILPTTTGAVTTIVPTTSEAATTVVATTLSPPTTDAATTVVPTSTEPVPTSTEPVPTTTEPVPTSTEPVPTTTEPVPTSTEPVPTSTEPVPTTTEPVPTSTEPVPTTTEAVPTSTAPETTTTEAPTTVLPTTTEAATTTMPATTSVAPETSEAATTMEPTTTEATTVLMTSSEAGTTLVPTTTELATTVITIAPTTTEAVTTVLPTTTDLVTTIEASTTEEGTTLAPITTETSTRIISTTTETTTAQPTTAEPATTTIDPTTTVLSSPSPPPMTTNPPTLPPPPATKSTSTTISLPEPKVLVLNGSTIVDSRVLFAALGSAAVASSGKEGEALLKYLVELDGDTFAPRQHRSIAYRHSFDQLNSVTTAVRGVDRDCLEVAPSPELTNAVKNFSSAPSSPSALERGVDKLLAYINNNITLEVLDEWRAAILLPFPAEPIYFDAPYSTLLQIKAQCLQHRVDPPKLNFTFLPNAKPKLTKTVTDEETIKESGEAVTISSAVGAAGGGLVASQIARSSIILGFRTCEPDEGILSTAEQPLGIPLGDSKYKYYYGGVVFNHVCVLLWATVQLLMAFVYKIVKKVGFSQGCEFSRFPSLLSFPVLLLLEPTTNCIVITFIYGDQTAKILSGISGFITLLYPIGTFVLLRKSVFHAQYFEDWESEQERRKVIFDDFEEDELFRGIEPHDTALTDLQLLARDDANRFQRKKNERTGQRLKGCKEKVEHFFFGRSKWKDCDSKAVNNDLTSNEALAEAMLDTTQKEKKASTTITDDDLDDLFAEELIPPSEKEKESLFNRLKTIRTANIQESDPSRGFTQRTRLFYCDYKGQYYRLIVLEMMMCIACGVVQGIKLGVGRCNGVLIALLCFLAVYLLIMIVVRPFVSPFLLCFSLVITLVQLVGAALVAAHAIGGAAEEVLAYAEYTTLVAMYLLMFRIVFDCGPKGYRWYKGILHRSQRKLKVLREKGAHIYDKIGVGLNLTKIASEPITEEERRTLYHPDHHNSSQAGALVVMQSTTFHTEEEEDSDAIEMEARRQNTAEISARRSESMLRNLFSEAKGTTLSDSDGDGADGNFSSTKRKKKLHNLLDAVDSTNEHDESRMEKLIEQLDELSEADHFQLVMEAVKRSRSFSKNGGGSNGRLKIDDETYHSLIQMQEEQQQQERHSDFFLSSDAAKLVTLLNSIGGVEASVLKQKILRRQAAERAEKAEVSSKSIKSGNKAKYTVDAELEALLNAVEQDAEERVEPPKGPSCRMSEGNFIGENVVSGIKQKPRFQFSNSLGNIGPSSRRPVDENKSIEIREDGTYTITDKKEEISEEAVEQQHNQQEAGEGVAEALIDELLQSESEDDHQTASTSVSGSVSTNSSNQSDDEDNDAFLDELLGNEENSASHNNAALTAELDELLSSQ